MLIIKIIHTAMLGDTETWLARTNHADFGTKITRKEKKFTWKGMEVLAVRCTAYPARFARGNAGFPISEDTG